MAAVLALASAFLYALKSVLQQKAAAAAPMKHSLRPGLLVHLAARPVWLAGTATDGMAFGLHFLALRFGSLALVQPLLVTSLLFALPLGAAFSGMQVTRRHWIGAVEVVVGLVVFLLAASPEAGDAYGSGSRWIVVGIGTTVLVGAVIAFAPKEPGPARAAALAVAAGVSYAVIAGLLKATSEALDGGLGSALTSWEPYALAVSGALGLLLGQSAFQAGPLGASLPLLIVLDPVASIGLGALAFGEQLATGPAALVLEVAALVVVIAGIFTLARSEAAMFAPTPPPANPG
ncbi:MAG: DMT family transporter [Acidimicrobiales bacterium]